MISGIWAIDMADKYPEASVFGIDLANIQPERIPSNLRFRIPQDFESPWTLGEGSFDLIHLRTGCGSVSSWPEIYQRIYDHLKPVYGSFEQVELDMVPRCDDGTLQPDSILLRWWGYLDEATARVNKPLAYNRWTGHMLQQAGFVDIHEHVMKIPLNSWPADLHLKDVGRWYNLGMTEGLEAFSLAPFTRVNHWHLDDVRRLVRDVKKVMCDKKVHSYNNLLVAHPHPSLCTEPLVIFLFFGGGLPLFIPLVPSPETVVSFAVLTSTRRHIWTARRPG